MVGRRKAMTAKDKATAGLWLLKQAILDLLKEPEHRAGMQPFQVRNALGLRSEENEAPGIAYAILRLMADDGDVEMTHEPLPFYFLPRNCGNEA
jgi:hypothetical protein